MARRHRLEYLRRKRQRAAERKLRQEYKAKRKYHKEIEREVKEDEEKSNLLKDIFGFFAYIAVIIGVTYVIITYVGQRTNVSGNSMLPTLENGDNLIVDKISYRFRDPERYDIIVFPYKYEEDTYYIKRIIGLPGDTIQVKEGKIYINGEILNESYGLEEIEIGKEGIARNPIVLGEEEYFVMGDNRNNSSDSRDTSVGVLKRDDLIGRAWIRVWPLDRIGVIQHE